MIYVGADWLTGLREERVQIHSEIELNIAFIPAFILVYRSIDWMFLSVPFILRTRREIRGLTWALMLVTSIAGVGFVLLPAQAAYPPQDPGMWKDFYAWNQRIVLTYNMVPSLHVALSVVTLGAFSYCCGILGKGLLLCWCLAIALSTLLTHHHHVFDVLTGGILGWGGLVAYRHWINGAQAGSEGLANRSNDPGQAV